MAWLGSSAGQVVSWSDTQVVAMVAPTALTGVARVQQNGVWSNAVGFTVPSQSGNAVTIMPAMLNMVVGDTQTIQALNGAGQPVTGLTWASSDPTVVSLSTDDPPLLTALVAGHVTITAGTASADVTVSDPANLPGGVLPVGTVLWSYPGDFWHIIPAVPSPSGEADVFAISTGTVTAIRSDGTTAWTASLETAGSVWADFQGGLIVQHEDQSLVRLDGATGQPITLLAAPSDPNTSQWFAAVHPYGTVFATQHRIIPYSPPPCLDPWGCPAPPPPPLPVDTVLGLDSTTGGQKFSVTLPQGLYTGGPGIIGGNGHFYISAWFGDTSAYNPPSLWVRTECHVVRMDTSGGFEDILVDEFTYGSQDGLVASCGGPLITNGDTGVVLSYDAGGNSRLATITGGGVSGIIQSDDTPMIQMQDGSYVGTDNSGNMVAFDLGGGERWAAPNYTPLMATADGGVIATSDWVSATVFDQNGAATGQMANLPTQSWRGNVYQQGSVDRMATPPLLLAQSLWAYLGGSPSGNNSAGRPWYFDISFENAFTFTPSYPGPNPLTELTTDISNRAVLIKAAALKEFQDAYSGKGNDHPVTVREGNHGGDVLVQVVNNQSLGSTSPDCGASQEYMDGSWAHQVDYALNQAGAQDAYKTVINNAQDEKAVLAIRLDMIQGIGRGIGTSAAHEAAHQFLHLCCAMDANPAVDFAARGTFNATGCNGLADPSPWTEYWPIPYIGLHWEQPTLTALGQCLNGGYRNSYGKSCHN